MRIVRKIIMLPMVFLLGVITFGTVLWLTVESTFLDGDFVQKAIAKGDVLPMLVDHIFENELNDMILSYGNASEEGTVLDEGDAQRISDAVRSHMSSEEAAEMLDQLILDTYRYVTEENSEIPVLDIGFIVEGISQAVPDLASSYLEDYQIPDTTVLAEYLEKGHDIGLVNDTSAARLITLIDASEVDLKGIDEATVKAFLKANEYNFKAGEFEAEVLTKTFIEEEIRMKINLEAYSEELTLEEIMSFFQTDYWTKIDHLKKEIPVAVTAVRGMVVVFGGGILLIILLLSTRFSDFSMITGATWLGIAAIAIFCIFYDLTAWVVSRKIPEFINELPASEAISRAIDNGLNSVVPMLEGVYLSINLFLAMFGGMLVLIVFVIRVSIEKTEEKNRALPFWIEVLKVSGAAALFCGLLWYGWHFIPVCS